MSIGLFASDQFELIEVSVLGEMLREQMKEKAWEEARSSWWDIQKSRNLCYSAADLDT